MVYLWRYRFSWFAVLQRCRENILYPQTFQPEKSCRLPGLPSQVQLLEIWGQEVGDQAVHLVPIAGREIMHCRWVTAGYALWFGNPRRCIYFEFWVAGNKHPALGFVSSRVCISSWIFEYDSRADFFWISCQINSISLWCCQRSCMTFFYYEVHDK